MQQHCSDEPNNPVGSQAPNPVNSHKILNTYATRELALRLSDPPALSYYAASAATSASPGVRGAAQRETLRGAIEADVAVLGGGIAGCSAALHLAKRGYRVALLEARVVGYGASGRSGGQTDFWTGRESKDAGGRSRAAMTPGACSICPSRRWISRNR